MHIGLLLLGIGRVYVRYTARIECVVQWQPRAQWDTRGFACLGSTASEAHVLPVLQELRTPAARSGVMEPSADAAAEALQQLSLGHPGAGSSSQAGQQLLYMRDPSGMATVAYQHASGSSGSSRLGGLQQPMQAVHIMGPGVAQQQVLVQVAPEEQQQQQLPIVVSAAGGDVRAAAGMQHMQAGTGGPPGIVAAALQQPPEMVVAQPFIQRQPQQLLQQPGYMYHEGLQQAQHPYHEALQQAQQLQQHHQRGAVAQSVEGGPLVHASAPADSTHRGPLLLQQQLMMPAQGWGEVAAAGQFQGIVQEGGGMSHMSYYAVPMPPGALQGQMVVPAAHNNPQQQPQMLHLQQPQPPQQQQQQHAYYHQQPQLVVYAAGNPAAAAGRSSSAMSFVPANPGPGQMQLLLSQQPGVQPGMQPGSGIVQVHAPPVAGIEQPGAYVPRSATDMAEPAAHYGLPQTGKW